MRRAPWLAAAGGHPLMPEVAAARVSSSVVIGVAGLLVPPALGGRVRDRYGRV